MGADGFWESGAVAGAEVPNSLTSEEATKLIGQFITKPGEFGNYIGTIKPPEFSGERSDF